VKREIISEVVICFLSTDKSFMCFSQSMLTCKCDSLMTWSSVTGATLHMSPVGRLQVVLASTFVESSSQTQDKKSNKILISILSPWWRITVTVAVGSLSKVCCRSHKHLAREGGEREKERREDGGREESEERETQTLEEIRAHTSLINDALSFKNGITRSEGIHTSQSELLMSRPKSIPCAAHALLLQINKGRWSSPL
jgi:hypothetical protein